MEGVCSTTPSHHHLLGRLWFHFAYFFQVLQLRPFALVLQFMTHNGNLNVKAKFEARVPAFYYVPQASDCL